MLQPMNLVILPQIEAAHALGMTYPQTLRRIILPEAFEVALPTLGNSFISIIKGTSLAFTCAVVEITAQGQIIGGRTYRYFEVYVSLAIIYWLVTLVIEQIIRVIENKIRIPDQVCSARWSRCRSTRGSCRRLPDDGSGRSWCGLQCPTARPSR